MREKASRRDRAKMMRESANGRDKAVEREVARTAETDSEQ